MRNKKPIVLLSQRQINEVFNIRSHARILFSTTHTGFSDYDAYWRINIEPTNSVNKIILIIDI